MGTEQRDNLRAIKTEVSRIFIHMDLSPFLKKLNKSFSSAQIHQLKEQFPEIFAAEESDKRLYFVGRMVLHDHASRRSQIKRQKKEAQRHRNMVPRKTRTQRNHQQEDGDIQVQEPRNLNHHPPPLPLPPHDPNQYQAIHGFLQASKPPMTHLMDVFVNFGCINTDFLLAISSWSSERIRGLLDRLPPGPDGKKVTEMDKFILQNHIKEYFAQL